MIYIIIMSSLIIKSDTKDLNLLSTKWTLWSHLSKDTDWSLDSYNNIATVSTLEECIGLLNAISLPLIKSNMLFFMKENINPVWEDNNNKNGGCFSFKITNNNIEEVWKNSVFMALGESLLNNSDIEITGISISPKSNFCILKIWTKSCDIQNISCLNTIPPLKHNTGCIFKKHKI